MDHMKILKRAWGILWSYRVLWIFGVLLALTSGGAGGNGGIGNYRFNDGNNPGSIFPRQEWRGVERFFGHLFSADMVGTWVTIGIAVLCLILLLAVLGRILYYVSHVALIRMVDEHERSGEKVGFRQGWRLGWSRAAWRLFLIDLLLYLPLIVIMFGMIGCGLLFLFSSGVLEGNDPRPAGIVGLIGMVFVVIMLALVVSVGVSLVQSIIRRYAVLENAGVMDSLRGGLGLIRRRFVDVFLMWLFLVGLTIAYTIVLIPVILILLLVAGLLGGGLGLAGYFGVQAIAGQGPAIVTALLLGLPALLLILIVPATFIEALRQVFGSTVWTLAYRELAQAPVLEALAPAPANLPSADLPEPGAQVF
jgi:hypothetical protein